jgi:hypothetical protein
LGRGILLRGRQKRKKEPIEEKMDLKMNVNEKGKFH